jgi:hypothetical protein
MESPCITLDRTAPVLEGRGYSIVYRENEVNHCPGCGRMHWYVGRLSAQCGFCETALPLATATSPGIGAHRHGQRSSSELEPRLA